MKPSDVFDLPVKLITSNEDERYFDLIHADEDDCHVLIAECITEEKDGAAIAKFINNYERLHEFVEEVSKAYIHHTELSSDPQVWPRFSDGYMVPGYKDAAKALLKELDK